MFVSEFVADPLLRGESLRPFPKHLDVQWNIGIWIRA